MAADETAERGIVPVVTAETAFVVPHSGELVNLLEPASVARVLDEIRDHEQRLREAKRILTDALVRESERQGSKTLRFGHIEAMVSGGDVTTYDVEFLMERLPEAGLPEERLTALIKTTVTHKVDAAQAKRIRSSPQYEEIFRLAERVEPRSHSVSVKRAR